MVKDMVLYGGRIERPTQPLSMAQPHFINDMKHPKGLYRINDTYYIAPCVQEINIMINKTNNENITPDGRTSGTDVSNLGDTNTMVMKTLGGKEITLRLYGR